jgi:ABC-type multidrug transport system fused ATPase/permease subunit
MQKTAMNIDGDIQFDDVSFHYPARKERLILKNLTMVARAGKTTALVGSSGCGEYCRSFIDASN